MNSELNKDQFSRREVYGALSNLFRYLYQDFEFDLHDMRKKFMEELEGENNDWGFAVDVIVDSDTGKIKEIKQVEPRQEADEEEDFIGISDAHIERELSCVEKVERLQEKIGVLDTQKDALQEDIQDLKQQLKEEKRLHQKCRDGLEGWSPPAKKEINRLLKENEGLKQQVEHHQANEEALGEELEYKDKLLTVANQTSDKLLNDLKEERNKNLRVEEDLSDTEDEVNVLMDKINEKDQQPKVEEILAELSEYNYKGSVSMRAVEDILKKHL